MVNRISKSIHANIKGLKDSKSTTAVIKNLSTIKKKALDKNLTPSKSEKIIPNENKSLENALIISYPICRYCKYITSCVLCALFCNLYLLLYLDHTLI